MCAPLDDVTLGPPGRAGAHEPVWELQGSRCPACANVAFPAARACQRCGSRSTEPTALSGNGRVWGHTVQRFAPKSPPYVPPADGFVPFAVGYVELPEGVKVEAVLECVDFQELPGAEVTLVALEPVPRFATHTALATGGPR